MYAPSVFRCSTTMTFSRFFPPRHLIALGTAILVGIPSAAQAALISHWEFDGSFIATVGTDGTGVNGAGFGPDRFGNPDSALSVNGASQQYVSVAGGGGLDGLQAGTIAFFAQWNGIQDSACCNSSANVAGRQGNGCHRLRPRRPGMYLNPESAGQ